MLSIHLNFRSYVVAGGSQNLLSYSFDINLRFTKDDYVKGVDIFDFLFDLPDEKPTPLHWATAVDDSPTIKMLIAHGADINAKTNSDITPLMIAAQVDNLRPLRIILERKPLIDDVEIFGNRAIHYIYNVREARESRYLYLQSSDRQDDKDRLELLVNAKANIDAMCSFAFNKDLKSIIDLAAHLGTVPAIKYLLYETCLGVQQLKHSLSNLASYDNNAADAALGNSDDLKRRLRDEKIYAGKQKLSEEFTNRKKWAYLLGFRR
ncbi:hypothetical protein KQX54_007538 [Cotesia glomerata]|uniref:Ankyrin repeat domain-containing protein n=1 Tax=Cotesia glomerata TaxID=32391 RepID=A0AAV7HVR5_COTGL|nr:hypothetical protein KQX54_007538 [Cotesia glomerata]